VAIKPVRPVGSRIRRPTQWTRKSRNGLLLDSYISLIARSSLIDGMKSTCSVISDPEVCIEIVLHAWRKTEMPNSAFLSFYLQAGRLASV